MTVHQLFPEQPGTSAPRVGSILPPEFSSTSAPKMPGRPVVAKTSDTPDLREVHKRVESYRTSKWPLTQAMKDAIALDDAVAVMHEAMGAERLIAAVHATTDAHELIAQQERTIASLRRQLREPS